jgi:hypothetical protein
MKKILLLLLVYVITNCIVAQKTYPSGVSGCIACWTFDAYEGVLDSIFDVSGNQHQVSNNNITSSPGWKGTNHIVGKFNGVSSWSEVLNNNMLNPNRITCIALIKRDSYSGAGQCNAIVYEGFDYNSDLSVAMNSDETDANCTNVLVQVKLNGTIPDSVFISPASNYFTTNK